MTYLNRSYGVFACFSTKKNYMFIMQISHYSPSFPQFDKKAPKLSVLIRIKNIRKTCR